MNRYRYVIFKICYIPSIIRFKAQLKPDILVEKVEDACKVGDMMWVKFMEIDEKGRWNLSHKDAMKEIRAKEAAGEKIQ